MVTYLRVQAETDRYRRADGLSAAWHTAAFSRARKLPSLRPLLQEVVRDPEEPQRPSADALLGKMRAIADRANARLGVR